MPPRRLALALACALATALGAVAPAGAVEASRTLNQLQHSAWTRTQGAPANIIGIAQTPDGYLWLGAPAGLFRFDGVQFEQVRSLDGVDISTWGLNGLHGEPDGGIWISWAARIGAGHYKDGRLKRYDSASGIGAALDITHDRDGNTWFATANGKLWRVSTQADGSRGAAQAIGPDWGWPEDEIARHLGVDPQGTLWVTVKGDGTNDRNDDGMLMTLSRGAKRFERVTGIGNNIAIGADGTLWGTSAERGLSSRAPAPTATAMQRVAEPAGTIAFDRQGALWVQTAQGITRIGRPGALDTPQPAKTMDDLFTPAKGLSSPVIRAIFEDREGNVWLGTSAGLDRFRDSKLVRMALPRRPGQYSIVPGDDGAVWAANWDPGLLKVDASGWRDFKQVPIGTSALHRDREGRIWVGNQLGVWQVRPGAQGDKIEPVAAPAQVVSDAVRAITLDAQQRPWFAPTGGNGVWRRSDAGWSRLASDAGFPTQWLANALLTDTRGITWVAHGEEIYRVDNGTATRLDAKAMGLDAGIVNLIYQRGERLWLLGNKALAVFDGQRFRQLLDAGNPREFARASGIVVTPDGDLWLNTADALLHVSKDEVERGLTDTRMPLRIERLREADGFRGTTISNGPVPTMAEASDGRIWVATDAGLAWIDPRRVARNAVAPQVLVRAVSFDGQPADAVAATGVQAPPQVRQVEFAYTATSLAMPERVQFRYRLEGVDRAWQDAGTRRAAYYTNLDPGRYRFEVLAANEDGVWSTQPATFSFEVQPAWFQTWWFRAAMVLLVVLAIWALSRLRMRQLAARARQREQLQQVERVRIARDLHDTLLQSVTGLILRFQAAAAGLPAGEPAREKLQSALDRADKLLIEGRECVTNLRDVASSSLSLEHALAHEALELAQDGATAFDLAVEGTPRELQAGARDELYRIAKEALVNAFRHARARRVKLELRYGWRELRLRIEDDGIGMDEALLATGREGHWGLTGMRERAEQLGARFVLRSAPNAGTRIELHVPARSAYAD